MTTSPLMGRRRFVQGLALGTGALGIGGLGMSPAKLLASQGQTGAATLSGNTFNLAIGGADVNLTGTTRPATLIPACFTLPAFSLSSGCQPGNGWPWARKRYAQVDGSQSVSRAMASVT